MVKNEYLNLVLIYRIADRILSVSIFLLTFSVYDIWLVLIVPFNFPFKIDWGDFGKSAGSPDTNAAVTVGDGIDWGISVESSAEVGALNTSVVCFFIYKSVIKTLS